MELPGRRGALLVLSALLVCVLLAVVAYRTVRTYQESRIRARFGEHVALEVGALEKELHRYVEVLHSLKAFFDSSEVVEREEFASFTRGMCARHPAIHALEWAPVVRAENRDAHTELTRSKGLLSYEIRDRVNGHMVPAPRREVHVPILYVEPREHNEEALGYDLMRNETRRTSMAAAVDGGEVVLSDPVTLVQEKGSSLGILMFLAVTNGAAATREERRAALQGFVLLVFRIEDIIERTMGRNGDPSVSRLSFRLFDESSTGDDVCLHSSGDYEASATMAGWDVEEDIEIGSQHWRLVAVPTPGFISRHRTNEPLLAGILGFLLASVACAGIVKLSRATRARVRREQAALMEAVLRSVSEGVIVADEGGEIIFANDAARALTGRSEGSVTAAEWSRRIGIHSADKESYVPPGALPLARALRGEQVSGDVIYLRNEHVPQGVFLSVTGGPLFDETQTVRGGVVVARDITAQREADETVRRLSNAVEQTADVVFITDAEGEILYVNPAFESTTGYAKEEVLGKTPRILKSGLHDQAYYEELWRSLKAGEIHRDTVINCKKNGDHYYSEQTISPITDKEGHVTHYVSVCKDMTESRKRQEHEVEMRLAAAIQQKLYPHRVPQLDGFDMAGAVVAAGQACGDYYDFIERPDGSVYVAIGDVSGHGFGPALVMAKTQAHLRSFLGMSPAIDQLLASLNRVLATDLEFGLFVTLFLARIDPATRSLVYATAGHPAPCLLDGSGALKDRLEVGGPALGIISDSAYACGSTVELEDGDVLVMYTDGIAETRGPGASFFGSDRVLDTVREHRTRSAQEIVDHLHRRVCEFADGEPVADDRTVVVCKAVAAREP